MTRHPQRTRPAYGSRFYRRFHAGRTDRPLQELPVLTKAMVMEHFDQLVTDPTVKLADVEAHWPVRDLPVGPGLDEWVTVLASYNRSLVSADNPSTHATTQRRAHPRVQVLIVSKASAGPSSGPPVLREPSAARVRATLIRAQATLRLEART